MWEEAQKIKIERTAAKGSLASRHWFLTSTLLLLMQGASRLPGQVVAHGRPRLLQPPSRHNPDRSPKPNHNRSPKRIQPIRRRCNQLGSVPGANG
jgi:hypothetical protein